MDRKLAAKEVSRPVALKFVGARTGNPEKISSPSEIASSLTDSLKNFTRPLAV